MLDNICDTIDGHHQQNDEGATNETEYLLSSTSSSLHHEITISSRTNSSSNNSSNNDGDSSISRRDDSSNSNSEEFDDSWLGRRRFGTIYPWMVAFSVIVYWTSVSLIPVYNKYLFQKTLYPYPIATAAIQLGVVSILCAAVNIVHMYFFSGPEAKHKNERTTTTTTIHTTTTTTDRIIEARSWILGPHFSMENEMVFSNWFFIRIEIQLFEYWFKTRPCKNSSTIAIF